MRLLKKLLVWLLGIVAFVALAGLVFVWAVLGVNPFEGKQDELWELTSYDVDFFVRFPGTRVLDDPIVEGLEEEPGFEDLAKLRYDLADATQRIAEQTAGQLPFGQEVHFENDFLGKEMAIAGSIRGDYNRLKVDNFLLLTRIAPYAKFISALKRGFVRDRIPELQGKIDLVKGLYFKVKVDPEVVEILDGFRSIKGGRGERDVVYMARIKDVLLISDNDLWIENAIYGSKEVLPADAWFESEFIRSARGGKAVEAFVRMQLSSHALQAHSRDEGTLIHTLEKILPIEMAGDLTIRAESRGANDLQISFTDLPGKDAFRKIEPHLQRLYDEEKADIRNEFSSEGIGRFIPRRNVVGALVLRGDAGQLVEMIQKLIPRGNLRDFDEEIRKSSKGRWQDFDRLLRHLTEDLAGTHLVVFHRPSVFENQTWENYEEPWDADPLPEGQMAVSVVSRVKDAVSPSAVEQKLTEHLEYLGLKSMGLDKEHNFRKALPIELSESGELELIKPAYGPIGNRFIFVSSLWEAGASLKSAVGNEEQQLISDPAIEAVVADLPREGTLGMVLHGPTLRKSLFDGVRGWARDRMGIAHHRTVEANRMRKEGLSEDEIARKLNDTMPEWKQIEFEKLREVYQENLSRLEILEAAGFVASLGVGSEKRIKAEFRVRLAGGAEPGGAE
ncbi:MAG: hypothetical protein ACYTHK_03560 [Planctomycetota bacterium]|jgi:hypothetical protein